MAYYNANEVIRLTRKAMGLTQEELCEGICEVVTLSRIENGHTSVKRSTYKKLMEKMGRIPETRYAVCVSKDGVLAEDRLELERAFKRYDFETAEYYLQRIKEYADDNLLTRQYIIRADALVNYRLGRIETEEFAKRLEEALRQTAPMYEQFFQKKQCLPFTKAELLILTSLASAYRKKEELTQSIQLYKVILRCLDAGYMGEPDNSRMQMLVRNSLAMVYEAQGEHSKALSEINKCLDIALKYEYGYMVTTLLSAKLFNIFKLTEQKKMGENSINEVKKLSQQAYYIAAARGDNKIKRLIDNFYHNFL